MLTRWDRALVPQDRWGCKKYRGVRVKKRKERVCQWHFRDRLHWRKWFYRKSQIELAARHRQLKSPWWRFEALIRPQGPSHGLWPVYRQWIVTLYSLGLHWLKWHKRRLDRSRLKDREGEDRSISEELQRCSTRRTDFWPLWPVQIQRVWPSGDESAPTIRYIKVSNDVSRDSASSRTKWEEPYRLPSL